MRLRWWSSESTNAATKLSIRLSNKFTRQFDLQKLPFNKKNKKQKKKERKSRRRKKNFGAPCRNSSPATFLTAFSDDNARRFSSTSIQLFDTTIRYKFQGYRLGLLLSIHQVGWRSWHHFLYKKMERKKEEGEERENRWKREVRTTSSSMRPQPPRQRFQTTIRIALSS